MTFPPIGVTAIIAGMAAFNRDAAIVEGRLLSINRVAGQLERETGGAFAAAGTAFGAMASTVSTGATLIGGGLLLAAGASIKFAADFQQGLALTSALTGATAQETQQLGETITDLSRHGILSMGDLAKAATELARSGVTISDVMGGALKAVQDLSTASGGELGLADAAKLTATAMQAFGINVADVAKVTTAATVVAQNSALTFTDFKQAVATAGAPFASVGFTIEDLAVAEALLGRNAMSGSVGATALRNIIQRLEKPSKDAAVVMKEYGIHLFDAAGRAVPLRDLIGQLSGAFGDQAIAAGKLTEKQRDTALATLFLQRAGAAALILTREGTKGYDELRASFDRLSVSDIVDKLLQPLNAQLKIGWNNVLALAYAFGDQFIPVLQEAAGHVVAFLQSITTGQVAAFGQTILAAATAVVQFGVALTTGVVTTVKDVITGLGLTDQAAQFLKTTMVGLAIVIGVTLLGPILAGVAALGVFLLAIGVVTTVAANVDTAIQSVGHSFALWISQFGPFGQAIGDVVRAASDGFGALGALFKGDFPDAIAYAQLSFKGFATTLQVDGGGALDAMQRGLQDAGAALAPWAAQHQVAGKIAGDALAGVSGIIQTLQFLLQDNLPAASQAAQSAMASFAAALNPIVTVIGTGLRDGLTWLFSTGFPALRSAVDNTTSALDAHRNELAGVGAALIALRVGLGIASLIQTLAGAWGALTAAVATAGGIVPAIVALLGGPLTLAIVGVAVVVGVLVAAWLNNWGDIQGKTEGVVSAVGAAMSALGSAVQSGAALALNTIVDAWNAIVAVTPATWGQMAAQIVDDVRQIVSDVGDLIPLATQIVVNTWNDALTMVLPIVQSMVQGIVGFFQPLGDLLGPPLAAALGVIGDALHAALELAGTLAAQIAGAIIDGIVGGILRNVGGVTGAIRSLMDSAVAAARASVQAHSPSRVFQQIGEDIDQGLADGIDGAAPVAESAGSMLGLITVEGLITTLDSLKVPVRASGAKLVDELVSSFTDIQGRASQALDDVGASMTAVGQKVGTQINTAIRDAADQITRTQQDAAKRIQDLQENLTQSRSDAARRAALGASQDAARQARQTGQEDADAAAAHQKDIDDAAFKHTQDLQKADAKAAQSLSEAKTGAQRAAIDKTQADERAAADERYREQLAGLARSFQASETDRLARRARTQDDANFDASLAKQTADLDRQLEDEALQRSIANAQKDRDARIDAINQALATKQQKLRDDASKELTDLSQNVQRRLGILQDEFAKKAADVLRKGGEDMRPLADNIQTILTGNFDLMSQGADGFARSVEDAIGALKRLDDTRKGVMLRGAALPSPTAGFGTADVGTPPAPPHYDNPNVPFGGAGGGGGLHVFGQGGVVPGPFGKPMLAIVHGGEFVTALGSEASRLARQMTQASSQYNREYNYNVNATYATAQSPASVEMDMRALIALSRGY